MLRNTLLSQNMCALHAHTSTELELSALYVSVHEHEQNQLGLTSLNVLPTTACALSMSLIRLECQVTTQTGSKPS